MTETKPHHGRNIKRFREWVGVKQETLAAELNWSQQKISLLEQKETIEAPTLEEVAKALKVPVEAIKNFDEEKAINIISNTFNDNAINMNYQCTFNPLDKYVEALEENKKLYERLLQAEKEKASLLEKILEIKK
jgi:transcriptional regulator with XRE-family HTH domain